jgi:hypothetical protein
MLAPTTSSWPDRGLDRSRAATTAAPWLLKPIRLINARSAGNRNSRGLGFPDCGSAVTVPTSTNAKPRAPRAHSPTASLSKPAASPSGPGSSRPNARTRSTGSRGASQCRSRRAQPGTEAAKRISANPPRCAVSAGIRLNTAENSSLYMAVLTIIRAPCRPGRGTRSCGSGDCGSRSIPVEQARRVRRWEGRWRRGARRRESSGSESRPGPPARTHHVAVA